MEKKRSIFEGKLPLPVVKIGLAYFHKNAELVQM